MLAYHEATGSAHDDYTDMIFLIIVIGKIQLIAKLSLEALKRNADTEEYYSPS
jgi:hypothetical protein